MGRQVKAAGVYCRISQDRGGQGLGVDRQERLCRRLAGEKGWPVAEVYVDNDLSAYSGKRRPAYERMLDDLRARVRDAVVVVDQDRLTRHGRELENFIELADNLGVPLANVSGDLDLSTSDGRFRARIMGAVARQESEKKSERIQRQREQAALSGEPHPGPRAFGFEAGNLALRRSEATLVQRAARDVLAGRSLRAVADDWNRRGVTTSRGREWTVNSVRDVLTSPRTAGLRRHRGEVVGKGTWPAILHRPTWEQLVTLTGSRRRTAGRPATKLLSGVAMCRECGGKMRSSVSKGVALYACRRQPGNGRNCGRLSISAAYADDEVRDQIIAAVAGMGLARALAARDSDDTYADLAVQLQRDENALQQLATDFYVDSVIGRAEFLRVRADLQKRITAARAALDATAGAPSVAGLPADEPALRDWWAEAPSDLRRALLGVFVDAVVVSPMDSKKPRRFDPDRMEIRWRV